MAARDRLADLVRQMDRAVLELEAERSLLRWEALRDEEAGWYSRGYLVHRLPAEITRSQRTGRPCGLALLQQGQDEPLVAGRWRPFLASRLDPVEVAVVYGQRELLFLFPELDEAATRARIVELANQARLAGLFSWGSTRVAWVSYPETSSSAGAILDRLEAGLIPLASAASSAEPPGTCAIGRTRATNGTSGAAGEGKQNSAAAAVIPPGRTYPGCFWFGREHVEIRAVLDAEEQEATGRRQLTVLTDKGHFRLEQAGQTWFAQKLDSAGLPS